LDPESPYIYCQYYDPLKKNSKQCNIPVLKSNPEPYCNYHKELAQKLKQDSKVADGALPIPPSTPTENDSFMDDADQDGEEEDNSELIMDESASTVAISASPVTSQTPQSISVSVPTITPTHNSNSSSSSSTSPSVTTTPGTVSTGTNATNHSTSAVIAMAATNITSTNITHAILPQGPAQTQQLHGTATSTMNNYTAS